MDTPIRIALVGCGGFAGNYLGVYKRLPAVSIATCFDADASVAASRAADFEDAQFTTNFQDVVACDAEIAMVSTPNHVHMEHASELLASGKHVLIQKPLARSLQEAEVIRLKAGNQSLGMYMSLLDFGFWWEVKALLDARNFFGETVQIIARIGHTGGLRWRTEDASNWRLKRSHAGGGAFIMLGVHYLHLIRWLTGASVKRVAAQSRNTLCPQIEGEDLCSVIGELSDGTTFELTTAWNSQGEQFGIYGSTGSLVYLDNEVVRVFGHEGLITSFFQYDTPGRWQTFPGVIPPPLDDDANVYNQHGQFVQAMRGGKKPTVGLEDGITDLRVVEAVYRSAASSSWEGIAE